VNETEGQPVGPVAASLLEVWRYRDLDAGDIVAHDLKV
jgi:hypothetical protein